MKIYPRQVRDILNTLPIGYYAGCRVPITLEEEGENSYIDLIRREIVIGYKLIEMGMEKVEDESYLESAIRAMLYHEVSHAILTPKCLKVTDIVNIFEDERIETILSNFFLNVDFKKNIKLINDWDSYCMTRPKDAKDAFYRAVRYRVGKDEWIKEVERIINDYKEVNSSYDYLYGYPWDIRELYNKIASEFPTTPTSEMTVPPSSTGESGKDGDSSKQDGHGDVRSSKEGSSSSPMSEGDGDKSEGGDGEEGEGQCGSGENEEGKDSSSKDSSEYDDCTSKGKGFSKSEIEKIRKMAQEILSKVEKGYYDSNLEQTLGRIIESFNRKNASGSAMQAYSGTINPRLVGRPDYRIFERASTEKGTNKFGTVHLNLFLDESGSYYGNQDETNKLIATLTQIEKTNKNFSMDIVYCGVGERLCDKKNRVMMCGGGNKLDEEIFKLYRQLQKPNTYNYNIVLFDGDAFTDCGSSRERYKKNFGAFNNSNCTIISDPSNEGAINRYAPSARKIFTRKYLDELLKNVSSALQFAFH